MLSLLTSACFVVYIIPQVYFSGSRNGCIRGILFHFSLVPCSAAERYGHKNEKHGMLHTFLRFSGRQNRLNLRRRFIDGTVHKKSNGLSGSGKFNQRLPCLSYGIQNGGKMARRLFFRNRTEDCAADFGFGNGISENRVGSTKTDSLR